jgi:PHD/YefM family antitoxin component YafN of YafNO toxin-antitoxin module
MKEEHGWRPDLDFLADSVRNNTRLIVINNPHNPTGYLMSETELDSVVELAVKHGIILFSDEVYRLLEYEEQDRLKPACELYDNAVTLGVMSKSYGLAGLRIGWVATGSRDIYHRMASYKDGFSGFIVYGVSASRSINRDLLLIGRSKLEGIKACRLHLRTPSHPSRFGEKAFLRASGRRAPRKACKRSGSSSAWITRMQTVKP